MEEYTSSTPTEPQNEVSEEANGADPFDFTKKLDKDKLSRLLAVFPPDELDVRGMMHTKDGTKAVPFFYLTARAVMDRLDEVFGIDWQLDTELIFQNDIKVAVKATITIVDTKSLIAISRSGIGEAEINYRKGEVVKHANEPFKSAESDAIKRAGVSLGIGRYLYSVPQLWLPWTGDTQWGHFVNDPRSDIFDAEGRIRESRATGKRSDMGESDSNNGVPSSDSGTESETKGYTRRGTTPSAPVSTPARTTRREGATAPTMDKNAVSDSLREFLAVCGYDDCLRDTLSATCEVVHATQVVEGITPMSAKQLALIISLADQMDIEYPTNLLVMTGKEASPMIQTMMEDVKKPRN